MNCQPQGALKLKSQKTIIQLFSHSFSECRSLCSRWTWIGFLVSTFALLSSCGSPPKMSAKQIPNSYPEVASLGSQLKQSRRQHVHFLSPNSFQKAHKAYKEATKLASADNPKANDVAMTGIEHMTNAKRNASKARLVFAEVFEARDLALQAEVNKISPEKLRKVDNEFKDVTSRYERGRVNHAKQDRNYLIGLYQELETFALKEDILERAQKSLDTAHHNRAADYAPKTYDKAEQELELALSVLENHRDSKLTANEHARRAVFEAQRSLAIADLVKEFRANGFTTEDIILWYQNRLSKVVSPITYDLPTNVPDHLLVKKLQDKIQAVVSERDELMNRLATSQAKHDGDLQAIANYERAVKSQQKILNDIQAMFSPDEADVYLQRGNILIRAHGFYFPVGSSEVKSQNFPLLKKVIASIKRFPNPVVIVSGHTDSTGGSVVNQKLSKDRAKNVASFLTNLGDVPSNHISWEGYGKTKPVKNNETRHGRDANRRVEFLIFPPYK